MRLDVYTPVAPFVDIFVPVLLYFDVAPIFFAVIVTAAFVCHSTMCIMSFNVDHL